MSKNLVIVESPAKAKTIEKFLGKDYEVKSCYGHVRDLPKGNEAIDINKQYQPQYQIPDDKKKVVNELKKLAKEAEKVWLATDEDREGEAIAWHLAEVLGLDKNEANRIVFHEITKSAIQEAMKNPRSINDKLVNAQQARRVLDRLVGFELSPILWRKMSFKGAMSAGRVQSVAVRLIVERERDIENFEPKSSFKVTAHFNVEDDNGKTNTLKAELPKKFDTEKEAQAFLESCQDASFTINDIQKKPAKRTPAAPFTTSTLQQEASRKLSFPVGKTMLLAQRLYEAGSITYMRTDSVNLSESARDQAAKQITSSYGEKYLKPRNYETKSEGAQEAHEAIRPTYISTKETGGDNDEKRLYDLIWKRTVASQMADAELEKTIVKIGISTNDEELTAKGEVLKFDGFLKLYVESTDDEEEQEDEGMLPPMKEGQGLQLAEMLATQRFTRPPSRYTEATLVRKLEELGIGRPSTYAPIISTIQKRGYVEKKSLDGWTRNYDVLQLSDGSIDKKQESETTGADKNKLFPTDAGKLVNDFLTDYFQNVMDYNFTARIEQEFDEIAHGEKEWAKMIDSFYKPFHESVEETMEKADRVTGERELGTDPKTGRPVIARMGKYGPMVQLGKTDDEEKPKFAKLREGQNIESVTLEEALDLFKLPRTLGEYEGEEVQASIGRYGPYVRHGNKFVSLGQDYDPYTINLDQAKELIEAKRKADRERTIKDFSDHDIMVYNGKYGPYIKAGKKNVKIPKDKDPKELTLEECQEIIENAPAKKGKGKGGGSGKGGSKAKKKS